MATPLHFGDPPTLGPFQLRGRLNEKPAGITYLGSDPQDQQVTVAVLTRGAAADAAARDRFRAAISRGLGVDREGSPVVAADPDGPAPWVATAYDPQHAGAERFLDPVAMTGAASGAMAGEQRGPDFQPHWAGSTEPAAPAPPRPHMPSTGGGGPHVGLLVLGIVAGVFVLVLGVSGSLLLMSGEQPALAPSPGTVTSSPAPTSARPSPTQPGGKGSTPGPLRTSGPKVVGAQWQPGDQIYPMEDLDGLGFSFRVPAGWGCMKSKYSTPPSSRWVCIDEQASWNGEDHVASFVVDVTPCDAPCDAAQRRTMRGRLTVHGTWRESDDATSYAQWNETQRGADFYHLAMSHFWRKGGSSTLNSQVIVLAEGPLEAKAELQKTVNDIRANTP